MNLNEFSLDHVAISVSNLDRSIDFYSNIFGFTFERIIEMADGFGSIALLNKADFTIEMFQIADVLPLPDESKIPGNDLKTMGVKHFAIRVRDIKIAADFLKQQGVEFISEPATGARGFKRLFVKDPDGMPLEITEGPVRG